MPDYTEIDPPYSSTLSRGLPTPIVSNGSVETQPVKTTGGMGDVWIDTFVRSTNWILKNRGFNIDGQTGKAEFSNVSIIGDITALTGTIGGFTIGINSLAGGTIIGGTIIGGTIETSTTGARVTIGSGNDISLYDDTTGGGGSFTGDSATIDLIRLNDTSKFFSIQRRHGINNDNDNVLEIMATPSASGSHNFLFLGGSGKGTILQNMGVVSLNANLISTETYSIDNGQIQCMVSVDGTTPTFPHLAIFDSRLFGSTYTGISSMISGSGVNSTVGFAESTAPVFYYAKGFGDATAVYTTVSLFPTVDYSLDLGRVSANWNNFYLNTTGQLNSDGSVGTPWPRTGASSGWGSTRLGPGHYRITHNLGTQNYTVTANAYTTSAWSCQVYVISANYFELQVTNISGTAVDCNTGFILTRNGNG